MIKAENSLKIRKNPRNFPEKTPKFPEKSQNFCRLVRQMGEGGPAIAGRLPNRGGFVQFFFSGKYFGYTPLHSSGIILKEFENYHHWVGN